ncbi:3-demethylubiquinone-9 3-methyltransferase [Seminavis robusta]|uniref:3-demethylubiquinone-9 3-methyltransferase n=1 Tax=Seminavis robusta TaxID=568900 RepID=A0A9N8DWC2_9STRA|nr:3-demethylubiquinone-9 3-methyltransferase [Seminavis robusta]|eukprot:Sro344_g122230.1 3-demethylubiquinone-9 3-methyltransferase (188) ;mRNA; f:40663-41226
MKSTGIYLTFDGNCADAFAHYSTVFQKKLGTNMTNGDSPMKDKMPKELHDKIMHCSLDIGMGDKFQLMGSDRNPMMHKEPFQLGNNTQISLTPHTKQETDRLFQELTSGGGKVLMPLAKQFWGSYFGSLVDKFGIQWMFEFPLNADDNNKEETKQQDDGSNSKHKLGEEGDDKKDNEDEPVAKKAKK